MIKKIPYLEDLGVSAVELLPVFAFDEQDAPAGIAQRLGIFSGLILRTAPAATARAWMRSAPWMSFATW